MTASSSARRTRSGPSWNSPDEPDNLAGARSRTMERWIERVLVAARWALAPIYLGLALLLLLLCVQFYRELAAVALHIHDGTTERRIVSALTLLDLALIAG